MRIKLSLLTAIAIMFSVALTSCKSKKGAGSANVRTLSLKYPANYTFSFAGKTVPDATVSTKELAAVDRIKILSNGKEVQNVTLKFKVRVSHDEIESASAENDGTELSSDVRSIISNAASGDVISFESIRIIAQGGEAVTYPPLSFKVK